MLIIGLSGVAGSGKTTAARFLSAHFNIPRRPFAYPLKRMIGALGVPGELLDAPSAVKELPYEQFGGRTLRYAMQTLGTEWGRVCMGEDFWVKQWEATLDGLPGGIADDVRFTNEANAILSRGGIVLRIERYGSGVKGDGAAHASEQLADVPYTRIVENNHSMEDFERQLLDAVRVDTSWANEGLKNVG